MCRAYKDYRFPFPVVTAAVRGDSEAIENIWRSFEPYINTLCARSYQDAYGNVAYMIDQDMKDYMKAQLAIAIVKNFDMYYGENKDE